MLPSFPVEIYTMVTVPSGSMCGLHVEVIDVPGVLQKVTQVIASHNANIVSITHSKHRPSEIVAVFVVVDLEGSDTTCDELAEELRGLQEVVNVRVLEPSYSLIVDEALFPLHLCGSRAIALNGACLKGLFVNLKKRFGAGLMSSLLFHLGRGVGLNLAEAYVNLIPRPSSTRRVEEMLKLLLKLMAAHGWARGELSRRGHVLALRLYDNFECVIQKGVFTGSTSHFVRGVIAGVVEGVLGRVVRVVETECINSGAEYCEFTVPLS